MPDSQFWIALIPLATIAGSAVAYIVKLYQEAAERRRKHFFELMQYIDGSGTIATKVAAIYELRSFPEHRDFIIRFCETQRGNISPARSTAGPAVEALIAEFDATRDFFKSR